MTGMALKFRTSQHLLLNGEAFWLLDRRLKINGAPTKIRMLQPAHILVNTAPNGDISEYVYRPPSGDVRLDPMDVVHFKLPDPEDVLRGHRSRNCRDRCPTLPGSRPRHLSRDSDLSTSPGMHRMFHAPHLPH